MNLLLAIILGVIVLVVLLKLALGLIALAVVLGAAVLVYFVAEKLIGQGR